MCWGWGGFNDLMFYSMHGDAYGFKLRNRAHMFVTLTISVNYWLYLIHAMEHIENFFLNHSAGHVYGFIKNVRYTLELFI